MKVKEAIAEIKRRPKEEWRSELLSWFTLEAKSRVKLRSHNSTPTHPLVVSVVEEMTRWIGKVAEGLDLELDVITILTSGSRIYAEYGFRSPEEIESITKLRKAYQRGVHPLDVISEGDLEAFFTSTMGSLLKGAEDLITNLPKPNKEAQ